VNPRVLGVIVVVGLLVAGLAIFYIAEPREPREKRSLPGKAAKAQVDKGPRQRAEPPPSLRPKTPISADEEKVEEDDPPELTLEQARREFDALITDLDREIARLEKSGGKLTEAEYVEYRTRGANAIDGVLRRLDHKDPNMMIEIKDKQEAARSRLEKIKP
jgi:hypothetical protein